MSTRGFIGFVADGTEKIAYNHCDSYPDYLGLKMLTWLRNDSASDPKALRESVRALRVVGDAELPTAEDIERLKPFTNLAVGRQGADDWYCLLRETQGEPGAMLRAGVIEDAATFPLDSLFAEWGYLVDTDAGTFEVYRGFQKTAHDKGRFAGRPLPDGMRNNGYKPCALVASWPLSALPSNEDFMATVDPEDAE